MARWKGLEDPQGRAWACGVSREHWGSAGAVLGQWLGGSPIVKKADQPAMHGFLHCLWGLPWAPSRTWLWLGDPVEQTLRILGKSLPISHRSLTRVNCLKPRRLGRVSGMLPLSPVAVTSLWKERRSLDDWPLDHLQNNLFFSLLTHFQKKQSYWWEVLY